MRSGKEVRAGRGAREMSSVGGKSSRRVSFLDIPSVMETPNISPNILTELLSSLGFDDEEVNKFLRVTLTKILDRAPGRTQYDGVKNNPIWEQIIDIYEPSNPVKLGDPGNDIHDDITELCPWFSPPPSDSKWTLQHIKRLVSES